MHNAIEMYSIQMRNKYNTDRGCTRFAVTAGKQRFVTVLYWNIRVFGNLLDDCIRCTDRPCVTPNWRVGTFCVQTTALALAFRTEILGVTCIPSTVYLQYHVFSPTLSFPTASFVKPNGSAKLSRRFCKTCDILKKVFCAVHSLCSNNNYSILKRLNDHFLVLNTSTLHAMAMQWERSLRMKIARVIIPGHGNLSTSTISN